MNPSGEKTDISSVEENSHDESHDCERCDALRMELARETTRRRQSEEALVAARREILDLQLRQHRLSEEVPSERQPVDPNRTGTSVERRDEAEATEQNRANEEEDEDSVDVDEESEDDDVASAYSQAQSLEEDAGNNDNRPRARPRWTRQEQLSMMNYIFQRGNDELRRATVDWTVWIDWENPHRRDWSAVVLRFRAIARLIRSGGVRSLEELERSFQAYFNPPRPNQR